MSEEAGTRREQHTRVVPAARLASGTILQDSYRIVRPLASGGMGDVYVATHMRLPGRFAVKAMHRDLLQDEDALSRFRCEAEILAALRHPNVVQVFDFNVADDGTPYLVMELLEGPDLGDCLREGPLAPRRVGAIVRQVASALEAAHVHGVVHRDLKPENVVLLDVTGHEDFVKLVDFGISKVRWSHRITAETAILGTPPFMAPEQAQGRQDEIDSRTDEFALACMAYTLFTGREPFRGENAVTILYQVVHQDPAPIGSHVSWPCARVEEVVRRGMAKSREARFSGTLELARALEAAIADDLDPAGSAPPRRKSVRARRPPVEASRPAQHITPHEYPTAALKPVRRPSGRTAAVGLVGLAAFLALSWYLEWGVWTNLGSTVGDAYRDTRQVASRTFARWSAAPVEAPIPIGGEKARVRGPDVIPLSEPPPAWTVSAHDEVASRQSAAAP